MGNANELKEIEKEIKYQHDKSNKNKAEINNDSFMNHLTILDRYTNYEPNFLKISLLAAAPEYKNSLLIK